MRLLWALAASSCCWLWQVHGGSVAITSSKPSSWWEKYPDSPVQFDRPHTFQHLGLPLRSMMNASDLAALMPELELRIPVAQETKRRLQEESAGTSELVDSGCIVSDLSKGPDGCWNRRAAYLPISFRATVVAVASGDSFRGWAYYMNTPKSELPSGQNTSQFLAFDEEITMVEQNKPNFDHGFWYYPVHDQGGVFPDYWPKDWTSPHNFTLGEWFFRYEVYQQPSNASTTFQFCIWQDDFQREICAPYWEAVLTGPPADGDVREINRVAAPVDGPAGCSSDFDGCVHTHCCASKDFQCKQSNAEFAQCRPAAEACPPDEWEWSCQVLSNEADTADGAANDTVISFLATTEETSTFWEWIKVAGLSALLVEPNSTYTILAPSNDAFGKLDADTARLVARKSDKLNELMLHHVIWDTYTDAAMAEAESVTPLLGEPMVYTSKAVTAGNKRAAVVKADLLAGNGVVHIIDTLIVPDSVVNDIPQEPPLPADVNREMDCSADFEDCLGTRCCQDPTHYCMEKDETYAQCRPLEAACPPDGDTETWSCSVLEYDPALVSTAPPSDIEGEEEMAGKGGGVGILVTSPAEWWQHNSDSPVDFKSPAGWDKIGVPFRAGDSDQGAFPGCHLTQKESDPENRCWDRHTDYYPMKARLTVLAAPAGHEATIDIAKYAEDGNVNGVLLIMDETITMDESYDPAGSYFNLIELEKYGSEETKANVTLPEGWPEDFMTPRDYYNGTWYIRFEVIEQPTLHPCILQFCIWDLVPNDAETCSPQVPIDINPLNTDEEEVLMASSVDGSATNSGDKRQRRLRRLASDHSRQKIFTPPAGPDMAVMALAILVVVAAAADGVLCTCMICRHRQATNAKSSTRSRTHAAAQRTKQVSPGITWRPREGGDGDMYVETFQNDPCVTQEKAAADAEDTTEPSGASEPSHPDSNEKAADNEGDQLTPAGGQTGRSTAPSLFGLLESLSLSQKAIASPTATTSSGCISVLDGDETLRAAIGRYCPPPSPPTDLPQLG